MKSEIISSYFASEHIEYYSVLPYGACRVTAPNIMERESFEPRSIILFLLPYYTSEGENLSSYATSRDYHIELRRICDGLAETLGKVYPEAHFKGYGDHSPIDERHAALIGGLGILGDSGLLINKKYGTYVFIGDLVTDIDPTLLGAIEPKDIEHCRHCGACLAACPTGALGGEGDCLSMITQKKGELNESERNAIREHGSVFGCDVCQTACPHNKVPERTPIAFFYEDRIPRLTREIVDNMSGAELKSRAFGWRGRALLLRNLEILEEKKSDG